MNDKFSIKNFFASKYLSFLFFLSFCIWCFAFRGFLIDRLALGSDALAYYEHIRFYLENLSRRVYPLWEPSRLAGVPTEFFMRRIGSYNPFFLLVLIYHKIGLPYTNAYILFLSTYYFIGMLGFYLLAKHVLRSTTVSFLVYLLLMFSSLGTRLFDSYFLFTVVPMIWFFTFFIKFANNPSRFALLGIVFTLMILSTTYIPFYFFTILMTFLITYSILYFRDFKNFCLSIVKFVKSDKVFVCFCICILLISLIPGIAFFKEMGKGEIVLPIRHAEVISEGIPEESKKHMIVVGEATTTTWGIEEDVAYSTYFQDLREMKYAVLYIPVFIYILFILGVITNINKKFIFFFLWGYFIYIISSPAGTPIYKFLREHIFYYKYFRNLHFFLWMAILPIFVFFIAEQIKVFLQIPRDSKKKKAGLVIFVCLVHLGMALFYQYTGTALPTVFGMLIFSFCFFILYVLGILKLDKPLTLTLLMLIVVIHPLEVYHYLGKNMTQSYSPYIYEKEKKPYLHVWLPDQINLDDIAKNEEKSGVANLEKFTKKNPPSVYIDLKWVNELRENLKPLVYSSYFRSKFLVYDRVELIKDEAHYLERIGAAFAKRENVAFVSSIGKGVEKFLLRGPVSTKAQVIADFSKELEILDFDVNHIKFKTRFHTDKFVVYNDGFHSKWNGFMDGEKIKLYRANVAFKGFIAPKGEHTFYFQYCKTWQHIYNYFMLALFYGTFITFFMLWRKQHCKL